MIEKINKTDTLWEVLIDDQGSNWIDIFFYNDYYYYIQFSRYTDSD